MATSNDFDMRDEDRLPWLETVDEDYETGPSPLRIIALIALALAVIAAALFGYQYYHKARGEAGNGALINAQEGDYKVKPDDPGGLKVEGEGDSAIATSDGAASGDAKINAEAVPEAPVAGTKAKAGAATTGAAKAVTAIPASGGALKAAPTGPARSASAGTSGGALVQLGSFPDEASANAAWTKTSKRFTYLAPLGKSVQKADVNGRTMYRLRVNAGSAGQASSLCGKLRVAGEACFVPND
ncbi:hypothetical protein ACVWZA_002067 [Sphingomonas sp. UYAg733]